LLYPLFRVLISSGAHPDPAESRWARFVGGAPSFANLSNGVSEASPHGFAG
jgi:hypothetical protein